jgi:hypothetical protein
MRYLSKIIFINSASIKYAEINVDGNVHFIGTQGVGKSTLLRALLFFYNANQLKLGIPVGKKSFVDFYLPYQDSYIIYEVVRETGPFCILAFKSQGRVCFRFIDSEYDKNYFIDSDGKANETWDKMKLSFKDISYSKKIDRYDDYRNILYGNNHGLGADFRKYSLLESKQYQNIPRAIQHVFLNYKVESEFIKDTIIKALNEEEIKIELLNYAHHLKDFDTQLNDIKKWVDKNRNGEVIVRKQADTIATIFSAIQFLDREKHQLGRELSWQVKETKKQQPRFLEKLDREETKQRELANKITDLDKKFQAKKDKITAEISIYNNKLKEVKVKSDNYDAMNIQSIIEKVAKKKDTEIEKNDLTKQKEILEARFTDIKQKYEAQINQFVNQLAAFENMQQTEIINANKILLNTKEQLSKEYEALFEEIKNQHHLKLEMAKNALEETKSAINKLYIKKAETKHQRFYDTEIEKCKVDINSLHEKIRIASNEIKQNFDEAETIKKLWELDKERIEEIFANKKEKYREQIKKAEEKITAIDTKIENNKGSLYDWLNNGYADWQNTIGKVIDEDNVLFQQGLKPEIIATKELNFYGIKLDLDEINKTVKTVADHEKDKVKLKKEIESFQKDIAALMNQSITDIENLKRKNQPKTSKCKEVIRNKEYACGQAKIKLDEAKVSLDEFIKKADTDKKAALENIEKDVQKASEASLHAASKVTAIEQSIQKQIENKRKDKDKKAAAEQVKVNDIIEQITLKIHHKKDRAAKEIAELKAAQKNELDLSGADTKRIYKIDERIIELQYELDFIEKKRDTVAEYNKDKRELFDKAGHFKDQKINFENQLETDQGKFDLQKQKLHEDVGLLNAVIATIKQQLANIQEDIDKYEDFILTDCFRSIQEIFLEPNDEYHTNEQCKKLIDQLNSAYYKAIDRFRELQEAINKFNGNFSPQNIFSFKTKLIEQAEYLQFAEDLKEFIEEDKISMYEKRVNELFADIIKQVGKETTELLSKEGEIQTVISDINKDFVKRNFAGVIKSIQLRVVQSSNKVVHFLTEIKKFNDENMYDLGKADLFSANEQTRETKNKKAIGLLTQLVKEMADYKSQQINLSDSFELEFKIIENDNDTNWVQNLANVGSDGTDVLVKAMINIMLLNVFKEGATKNKFKDFKLHCMMDEIGKLHPTNVRGILKFANDRNINLINSSPQSFDALAYRYTYKLAKDERNVTIVNRLITNHRERQ